MLLVSALVSINLVSGKTPRMHFLEYDGRWIILISASQSHSNSLQSIIVAMIYMRALGLRIFYLLSPVVVVSGRTHTLLLDFFTFGRYAVLLPKRNVRRLEVHLNVSPIIIARSISNLSWGII